MSQADFQVDLTNCDREPIHQLGAIQPFGFLVALSSDWLVQRASANVSRFLGVEAADILGTPLSDHIDGETLHAIRNRLTLLRGPDAVERVFGLKLRTGGQKFDFAVHMTDDTIVLEAEPSADTPNADAASTIRAMMTRLDATEEVTGFLREGARQIRALTGFDRVMVYQFDRDGSGTVMAEAARSGIGSFHGLRYPASDIPQQARRLYIRTPFRIIADVDAEPVEIVPQRDEQGQPLDLSLSVLRSVSPIHIEYLKNMGVAASLSISIIVEGKLWGLFACHHYEPRCPDFERRSIAELFGQMFALKLESRERKALARYEIDARTTSDRILASVAGDATLLDNPDWLASMLGKTVPCDGIGISIDGKIATSGITPPASFIPALTRRLNAMAAGRIYATDYLSGLMPQAEEYADVGAGVLAIPISRRPRDYVLLFRQEKVRTVTWGGNPHKIESYGPNGSRLSPRKSFELWAEEVRGRSEPFSGPELRVAEMLRASLIEVVLRLSDDAQAERQRASERQELLIAELNHRVRNILSLIRGLVRQSHDTGTDLSSYIKLLEGRIESLARAHDQITQDNWSPAPLRRLIETEAAAYLAGKANRVKVEGPTVLLHPHAFSTLALVLHELMTNSAKYGALSDNGSLTITLRLDEDGDCFIQWRERGGPAVQPPRRKGFGTTIIERSIPYDLGGSADIRFPLTGMEADFCIPARYVAAEASGGVEDYAAPAAPPVQRPQPGDPAILSGHILLVEDSLIIAMDAEDILLQLGAERVSIAAGVAPALREIDNAEFRLAVLDVNLGSETSLPIADALRKKDVPYIFATGYGEQFVAPEEHRSAPILQKPYTAANMGRLLADVIDKD